jgi:hypothetical protein
MTESAVSFHSMFPSVGGRYRMFLQFAYNGRLRTVACPVEVSPWTPQGYEDRGQQPRPSPLPGS